jgi:hypothetical protein
VRYEFVGAYPEIVLVCRPSDHRFRRNPSVVWVSPKTSVSGKSFGRPELPGRSSGPPNRPGSGPASGLVHGILAGKHAESACFCAEMIRTVYPSGLAGYERWRRRRACAVRIPTVFAVMRPLTSPDVVRAVGLELRSRPSGRGRADPEKCLPPGLLINRRSPGPARMGAIRNDP